MPPASISIALDHFTTFGDLLKYLRRRVGMTQRELSIAVGYSDTQISRLEQNERLPDLATLTARFLPALHLEDQPEAARRLLELAATMRREDAPAAGLPPYKGLLFFDEGDAELFFGREALTKLLVERLAERLEGEHRFLAVVGASGSGKSSVVRAGLVPALHWQQPSSSWPVMTLTPTAHPLEALAASLVEETRQSQPVRKLVDELERDPQALHRYLKRAAQAAGAEYCVLIVDQFEETFTLCRSEGERSGFIECLMTAACQPGGPAMIVIVLRADFYAHCAQFNTLRRVISQHQEYIGPMTNEELRRAIEEPARHGHWEFEPGLVDLLLHDIGADVGHIPEPGALPLLSHALLSTWQRRRGRLLTLSGYTASGGVRGAIAETAEAVFYDQLEPEQRDIARQIFLRLTELGGETAAGTRRRVSFNELVSHPGDQAVVHDVLQTLADARLITTDQDSAEVAHEALIREWPTLRGWLEEDRESLRLHRRLTEAAQEWDALGRDAGILYRGSRLAQALGWAELHPEDVNLLERAFLDASQSLLEKELVEREAQQRRELEAAQRLAETERARAEEQTLSSQRLRLRALILAAALVMAGMLAVTALWFGQRAVQANRLATSRELASAALNNLQIDPERSALLALQALDEADTLEARNALHQALPELHILMTIPAHEGGVPDVAYSSDGAQIASMGARGEVKLWDADSGDLLRTFNNETGEAGSSLAFSPDGRTVAAAWVTQVVLWNVHSGEKLAAFSGETVGATAGYNLAVGQISFSPDGKRLAAANLDGASRVWELASQQEVLSLSVDEMQPPKAIAYSPDGKLIANGGDEGIVWVWDAYGGEQIFALSLGGVIHSVSFSPEGALLTAGSEDGSVKVWEVATGEVILKLPRLSGLYDIAFLVDGNFATAGQDGTARVWDPHTGEQILTLAGPTSTVIGVAGSPDGKRIVTGAYDGSLRIWDAAPGRELLTIPAHAGIIWDLVYTPDGSRLASASVDGFARLWNAETGGLALSLSQGSAPTDGFTSLAISPDGSWLATGSITGTIKLWHSQTGALLKSLDGHSNMVVRLVFSPDGRRLASASWDGSARVWDLSNGEAVTTFRGHAATALVTGLAFSPDGKTVFTGADDRFVYQWEAATGQVIRTFPGDGKEIYAVAVSPDGSLLAMGDQDGTIILWDIASGEKRRTLSGHASLVLRLDFNQDGTRLASASFDRLAKVWDMGSGEELASLYGSPSNVFGVAFSPDGAHLAAAGADGSIRLYTLRLDDLVALAHARLKRTMTEAECQKFLRQETCPTAALSR